MFMNGGVVPVHHLSDLGLGGRHGLGLDIRDYLLLHARLDLRFHWSRDHVFHGGLGRGFGLGLNGLGQVTLGLLVHDLETAKLRNSCNESYSLQAPLGTEERREVSLPPGWRIVLTSQNEAQ